MFQSHNGAIAARNRITIPLRDSQFQSHNGAIAACADLTDLNCFVTSFNPTMVRLLRASWQRRMVLGCVFQSHNGAIAALQLYNLPHLPPSVSIPQWCDCCDQFPYAADHFPSCFNPTMVRLLQFRFWVSSSSSTWFQSHNGAIAASKRSQVT